MTCPNNTGDKSAPNLRLIMLGVLTPSLNKTNHLHWSDRNRLRKAWSILIARCLYELRGSAGDNLIRITSPAAVKSYATQSLPRSVEKVIHPKMGLLGNMSKKTVIEIWEGEE